MSYNSSVVFDDLLNGDTALVMEANNELARIWRLILVHVKPSPARWQALLETYRISACAAQDESAGHTTKANLSTSLRKDDLTWAIFVKGLMILNFEAITIDFVFKRKGDCVYSRKCELTTIKGTKKDYPKNNDPLGFSLFLNERIIKSINLITQMWETIRGDMVPIDYDRYLELYSERVYKQLVYEGTVEKETPKTISVAVNKNQKQPDISWKTFITCLQVIEIDTVVMNIELKGIESHNIPITLNLSS